MLRLGTHFEQGSVKMVLIVEVQIDQTSTIEQSQRTERSSLEACWETQAQSMAKSRTFSQAEV
jgi:hypothetical protein